MRVLLDTHTLLWFLAGDQRCSRPARVAIEDLNNEALVSVASLWELAIKFSLGKLELAVPFGQFVAKHFTSDAFALLPIELDELDLLTTLPLHHRDPFDRLLIAQALVRGIPLLSADTVFDRYGVERLW
jgi:PIN domain nuclease of toxin-antitoxin system